MTAQARRARQKQATREGILQAALTIGEQEGWPAVTIRRIADAVEYTSPIIYQYFASKEAALQAVMAQGYERLRLALQAAGAEPDPERRLRGLCRAYLGFAQDHPALYELMTGLGGVRLDGRARHEAASGVIRLTLEAIGAWARHKGVSLPDPLAASETAWGVLHGMATLGLLEDIGFERARSHAENAVCALLRSWEEPVV